MFNCARCNSAFLRKDDALKCFARDLEKPLISVGKILIDRSYDEETKIRCYSISPRGHELIYRFEWQDPDTSEWGHVYSFHGNWSLKDNFSKQLT